jgi:hypothetical protein
MLQENTKEDLYNKIDSIQEQLKLLEKTKIALDELINSNNIIDNLKKNIEISKENDKGISQDELPNEVQQYSKTEELEDHDTQLQKIKSNIFIDIIKLRKSLNLELLKAEVPQKQIQETINRLDEIQSREAYYKIETIQDNLSELNVSSTEDIVIKLKEITKSLDEIINEFKNELENETSPSEQQLERFQKISEVHGQLNKIFYASQELHILEKFKNLLNKESLSQNELKECSKLLEEVKTCEYMKISYLAQEITKLTLDEAKDPKILKLKLDELKNSLENKSENLRDEASKLALHEAKYLNAIKKNKNLTNEEFLGLLRFYHELKIVTSSISHKGFNNDLSKSLINELADNLTIIIDPKSALVSTAKELTKLGLDVAGEYTFSTTKIVGLVAEFLEKIKTFKENQKIMDLGLSESDLQLTLSAIMSQMLDREENIEFIKELSKDERIFENIPSKFIGVKPLTLLEICGAVVATETIKLLVEGKIDKKYQLSADNQSFAPYIKIIEGELEKRLAPIRDKYLKDSRLHHEAIAATKTIPKGAIVANICNRVALSTAHTTQKSTITI